MLYLYPHAPVCIQFMYNVASILLRNIAGFFFKPNIPECLLLIL